MDATEKKQAVPQQPDQQPQDAEDKLTLKEKAGYGMSYLGVEMVNQFNSYLTYFLTNVFGLSMGTASIVTGLNTAWNAVNDPLLGYWADNRTFKTGEKLRPFWKYCCLPMALFCVLMYVAPELPTWGKVAYILAAYFMYDSFSTLITIPNYGMPVVMTSKVEERASLSAWAMVLDTIGICLYALAMPMIQAFGGGYDEVGNIVDGRRGFLITCAIYCAVFVVAELCAYFSTRERVEPISDSSEKIGLGEMLRLLFSERNWVVNMLYMLGYALTSSIVTGYLLYYAQYVLHDSSLYTPILVAFLLCDLVGAPLAKVVDSRIGHRGTMLIGAALLAVARIPSMVAPTSMAAIFTNAAIMGFGMAFAIVTINIVQSESVDLIEWKQGKRVVASASSVRSLVYKGSTALALFIIGQVLSYTGYDSTVATQTAATEAVLNACVSSIPFVLAIFMFICALFLTVDKDAKVMRDEKAARAAEEQAAAGRAAAEGAGGKGAGGEGAAGAVAAQADGAAATVAAGPGGVPGEAPGGAPGPDRS